MQYTVILRSGKDKSLRRFHPWVFSGAIKKIKNEHGREAVPPNGAMVRVIDNKDQFLGMGHYQDGSIAVRIVSFAKDEPDTDLWINRLTSAVSYRDMLGLLDGEHTNVCRLVHAEGDGLPGLIIDYYNGTAVVQCHSIGMHQHRDAIVEAIRSALGDRCTAIYDKSAETLPAKVRDKVSNGYLWGDGPGNTIVKENGSQFKVDWVNGQKTGFFVDQRENRQLLANYSEGATVLNTFCYTGGFSIAALHAGAEAVHSVDSSARAIELTNENVALNFPNGAPHTSTAEDTMKFLRSNGTAYDIIVLDPPAYAKSQKVKHNAVQGYKRLNAEALAQIKPGGMLFTFSCSQVVDRSLFYNTLVAAAISVGRSIRVMHHLSQPPDHPVNIYHPEGEYLKGLVLLVD